VRALLAAAAIPLLLAGCSGTGGVVPPPATLPDGWNGGVLLHAFETFGAHSGAYGANLNTTSLARPATCQTYRGTSHLAVDGCEVRDPAKYEQPGNVYPKGVGAWVVEANWAGCPGGDFGGCHGQPQPGTGERRVVGFDAAGVPVAWWAGQTSKDTRFVTE
jgi:hypothetical protein